MPIDADVTARILLEAIGLDGKHHARQIINVHLPAVSALRERFASTRHPAA